jgi:hypothetical protein
VQLAPQAWTAWTALAARVVCSQGASPVVTAEHSESQAPTASLGCWAFRVCSLAPRECRSALDCQCRRAWSAFWVHPGSKASMGWQGCVLVPSLAAVSSHRRAPTLPLESVASAAQIRAGRAAHSHARHLVAVTERTAASPR